MATETPIIRMRNSAAADTAPMWLRISVGGVSGGDDDMPIIGEVRMFAGAVPSLWINLSSGPVSRTTFAALFAYLGTTWGPGNGTTTFDLPPSQRLPIAAGAKVGLTTRTLAAVGGGESVTLTAGQSGLPGGISLTVLDPDHSHDPGTLAGTGHTHALTAAGVSINDPGHQHSLGGPAFVTDAAGSEYVNAAGDKGLTANFVTLEQTNITADVTGDTDSQSVPMNTGNTANSSTGVMVETVATPAADPVNLMNPFAVYNFAIYAGA